MPTKHWSENAGFSFLLEATLLLGMFKRNLVDQYLRQRAIKKGGGGDFKYASKPNSRPKHLFLKTCIDFARVKAIFIVVCNPLGEILTLHHLT